MSAATQNSYYAIHEDLFETDDSKASAGLWSLIIKLLISFKLDELIESFGNMLIG